MKQRKQDFYFSDPIIATNKVFFHLKSFHFNWKGMEHLASQKLQIGITQDYTYGEEFDSFVKRGLLNTQVVVRDELNIKKLFSGRIDIFPMDINVGYSIARELLVTEQFMILTNHQIPVVSSYLALAVSKKIPKKRADQILTLLNKGMKSLRESGEYDDMMWDFRQGKYKP